MASPICRGFSYQKILGMAPGREREGWGLGAQLQKNVRKTPFLLYENALFEHRESPHIDEQAV